MVVIKLALFWSPFVGKTSLYIVIRTGNGHGPDWSANSWITNPSILFGPKLRHVSPSEGRFMGLRIVNPGRL